VQGPNWDARRATVVVTRNGREVTVLTPDRRNFPVGRMTTTEAAIHTTWLADIYVVLGEERDDGGVLRLHHNRWRPGSGSALPSWR